MSSSPFMNHLRSELRIRGYSMPNKVGAYRQYSLPMRLNRFLIKLRVSEIG